MAYDISINISASGADAVEREFKKIEAAYRNLQNMGMNFSQASGIKSLSQDISSLVTSINTFSSRITAAISQVNSLAAAIKTAATNAQTLSNTLNVKIPTVSGAAASSSSGTSSSGGQSRSGGSSLSILEAAELRANQEHLALIKKSAKAQFDAAEAKKQAIAELGVQQAAIENKIADNRRRMGEGRDQRKFAGQFTPGFDPSFSGEGMKNAALNSIIDELRSKQIKHLSGSKNLRSHAEGLMMAGLSGDDLTEFQRMLSIDGNKPQSWRSRVWDAAKASPLGMASLFMLRYRMMTAAIDAASRSASVMAGASRSDMVGPNFELASIGFNAPMRAGLESKAIALSNTIPGLTMPNYFKAFAQVGSALDVKERGVGNIAAGTRASLMFGSLSNLGPEQAGQLLSRSYYALQDTPEFKGVNAGQAMEKIAALMTGAISVSGAWGQDITKSFAHFLPMGIKSGMSLKEMLAFTSTLTTQGFHSGSGGRYGKWLLGDKGMEFMGRAMVFGEGEAGADYYDTNTHAAMQALRAKGVKPGQAKQINKDVAREMGKVMADRYAEDPLGTLALIGEKMKSALEKGFTLKDLGASQDFLAAITKTFMGGGSGDMQEMSRRIGEEGTVSGMEEKYGEAVRGEVGAAWEMLKASISNMADAFSKTSPLYTSIDGLARFMNDIAGRWSRETTLSLGGTINPETGMPFKNKEEGKAFGIQSEAITGAESWRSTLKWLGIDISQDSFKGLIDLHKDYYDSGLHETFVPKIHGMMGLYARGKANAAYDAASSWWRGYRRRKSEASLKTPEELEAMRISGDPGYEVALRRDKTARENLDIYSVEEEAIAKRQDPFLTRNARFSNADVDALKRGGSNKELSESARNWWSNNWKKVMGVKSVSELMNPRMWGVDKFDQENAPPVIRYGWGYDPYWEGHGVKQGFGLDSAVPEMSEAMSRQGKLDISGVGSSLAELVAAIKKAAGDINKATENIQPKTPGGGNPKVNSSIPPG